MVISVHFLCNIINESVVLGEYPSVKLRTFSVVNKYLADIYIVLI